MDCKNLIILWLFIVVWFIDEVSGDNVVSMLYIVKFVKMLMIINWYVCCVYNRYWNEWWIFLLIFGVCDFGICVVLINFNVLKI